MAKTTDFLSQTSGKLTEQFTTRQTAFGTILARTPKKSNKPRRSEKQANMRCQMANMSANFKLFHGKLKQAWEGKEVGLSEFNKFVQSNYDNEPVYITKQMRIAGACVLAKSVISDGSLPSIGVSLTSSGVLKTDINLGSLNIGAGTTVADLSIAIINNNNDWEHGDQLTLFLGNQWVDSRGIPRASIVTEKVIMDTTNETPLLEEVSTTGFATVDGQLGMSIVLQNAGAAYVHSREKGNKNITVSSQQMYVVSDILDDYQGYAAMKASADSYGGITIENAYLNPNSSGFVNFNGIENGNQNGGNTGDTSGGSTDSGNGGTTEPVVVSQPVFSGETQFEESTQVTMSAEEGASIHYTLDGSTPTSASTLYSGPVTLSNTTTVKAIAIKDGVSSTVASRTYTKTSGGGGDDGME